VVTKKAPKKSGKLEVKKETIKNLDVKKSGNVKGGVPMSSLCNKTITAACGISLEAQCKLRQD
jgi:hypothetical protein